MSVKQRIIKHVNNDLGFKNHELITLRKYLDLFMWSTLISSEEIRNYKLSEGTARQFMSIGIHTITYSAFGQIIGKLKWEIKL